MVKKKQKESDNGDDELSIPIPIQTFLWRQTSPFIRPKLTKLCEASCVSFERVIVQNILHGLSPSLCEAIQSISRWKFVRAALPHVIHCCAAILKNRAETNPESKFNSIETKLLYTLHWIILDAAAECEDTEPGKQEHTSNSAYLHSLDTIQLFVFLLVPLISSLRHSDFENLKLENGLRLWEPLWHYQQPNVPCFSTPVKSKHLALKTSNETSRVNFNMANIYLGQETSSEGIFSGSEDKNETTDNESRESSSKNAPLAQMSDICALSNRNSMEESATFTRTSLMLSSSDQDKVTDLNFNSDPIFVNKISQIFTGRPSSSAVDIISATYFDVALLQSLFCPQWDEEGVNWALQYILKRLIDIKLESARLKKARQFSCSMPNLEMTKEHEHISLSFPRKDSASVEAFLASCSFPHAMCQSLPEKNKVLTNLRSFYLDSTRNASAHSPRATFENPTIVCKTDTSNMGSNSPTTACLGKKEGTELFDRHPQPIQKPIITITCDNSKPFPNFAWPVKKMTEIGSTMQKQALDDPVSYDVSQNDNMQRSNTDSKIHYTNTEDMNEASGSTFYVGSDGQLKYDVILLAIYNLSSRHYSSRVCNIVVDIIKCFIDLNFFKKPSKSEHAMRSKKKYDNGGKHIANEAHRSPFKKSLSKADADSMFCMALDILFRVFRAVGCVHGCSDCSFKIADSFRDRMFDCLEKLMDVDTSQFRKYLLTQFIEQPLQLLIESLHVLLGYCSDTINIYHMGGAKKHSMCDFHSSLGYSNNFGEPPMNLNSVQNKIVVCIWKKLLVKFVEGKKEIFAHENIHLYHEVKQLVNYMKDNNGSTFRCVALSFLCDAFKSSGKFSQEQVSCTMGEEEKDNQLHSTADCPPYKSKSLFKKKTKKHSFPSPMDNTIEDPVAYHVHASPRTSIFSIADDDIQFLAKKKPVKIFRGFHKSPKSDTEEDSSKDYGNGANEALIFAKGQRMSFKATGQATMRLLSARRKLEDGFKSFGRKHGNKRESICEGNLFGNGSQHNVPYSAKNSTLVREKKLINSYVMKSGLVRFNFLLEFCNPGTLPDPPLIASLLDLEAPVLGRAALLLECAHFVNRCNHGDWPNWMKLNYGGLCSTGRGHMSHQSISSRNLSMQKAAGELFYQWAETLGNRLSEILIDENPDFYSFINKTNDDGKKQDVRQGDHDEDYLDEETVNRGGRECPHPLKLVACHLLYEITAYLRETHQNLPRIKCQHYEKVPDNKSDPNRRWSSVFTSPENSEFSSTNKGQGEAGSDRKISFAVLGVTTRSDSMHSSTNSISQANTDNSSSEIKSGKKPVIQSGQKLLRTRRGSDQNSTFRHNRSFKITHHNEPGLSRVASTKHRKVSTQSLHSANSTEETVSSSYAIFEEEENEEGVISGPGEVEHPSGVYYEDKGLDENMPWVKVVVQLANKSNFVCDHQNFCHTNCYERQRRSCTRLVLALKKVYSSILLQSCSTENIPSFKTQAEKIKHKESTKHRRTSSSSGPHHSPHSSKSNCSVGSTSSDRHDDGDPSHILKYLDNQVANLTQSPLAVIAKAAPILSDDIFIDIMPIAWELLLESDQELAAVAASVFILSSIRVPEHMQEMITYQFHHQDVSFRIGAILRFSTIWNSRFQVWHRMEDGAQLHFKVPPPNIDFVLPSPTIGLANIPVIDSPWMPHFKTKVEEVTINQKESKSLVNATTTRRKQQQQMIHQALLAEEDKRRVARENCLMTSVPVCLMASVEPALLHSNEDHDDALQEELSLAVATRRMSVAVVNRASNVRNLSGRHGSVFFCRPPMQVEDDDKPYQLHSNQMHLAQPFFPSFICQSTINIIQCLSDFEVNADGTSVSEVAEKIIWKCLVEDPALFLRTFLEKLTNKNRQKELIFLLRKLLWHIPILPSQAAHCLFNYLIGFVMFHVRSPSEGGLEAITEALSIVWQVVPCVTGIYFKDLKQTLRKEQCDSTLLVAANVPSAKKLIVHGPDLSCIPSQFLIQEDTQFVHILQESLEFFNIPADAHQEYFLVDTKTNHMHSMNSYVRDFYFFRRNFYPQLSLVRMNHDEAKTVLERETFRLKFLETEKVLFSLAVLNSSQGSQFQSHVTYLHEEFLKLPSFPRKALETELFSQLGATKHEILEMDMLHKFSWTMLISTMFRGMSSAITHVGDLPLFLNVINGVTILHADDVFLLRFLIATYINVCRHFKQVFSTTGFSFILRTILKVYSSSSSNVITIRAIQFVCRQFFLLHRNSFVLQLFGIVSSMLETGLTSKTPDKKLDTKLFYDLLVSMNEDISDELDILELMDDERPIQSLDFCYKDDPNTFSIMDAMNLCVTVVAHSVESVRASQMLTIMEAILPHFLSNTLCQHPRSFHDTSVIDEILIINNLTVFIKILVSSCESMARFNRFQFEPNTKPLQGLSSQSPKPKKHRDDPTEFRFVNIEEGNSSQFQEFVKPRNSVLSIASDFYLPCLMRSRELHNLDPSLKIPDLLDHKSHVRLADIAHSLLKVSAHDPATINSVGLQKYMIKVMPNTDWSQASIRPALNLILRRIERFLNKIYKRLIPLANLNWDAITNLISAINSTLANCSFIGHLPQMKALVYACIHLVMGDEGLSNTGSSYSIPHRVESNSSFKSICPLQFCSVSIKLALRLISILGDSYSLEQLCEASASMYSSVEKLMGVIINIIFPSSLELSNHKIKLDCMVPRKSDVTFALTIILSALHPNFKHSTGRGDADGRSLMGISSSYNTGSHLPPENFTKVVFLGLKILMVCFEKQLSTEWHKIAKVITQMVCNRMGGTELWSFLDFVISCRGALFVLLLPLIQHKLTKGLSESSHKYQMVDAIKKRLNSYDTSDKRSSYNILLGFATNSTKIEEDIPNNFDFDKLRTFKTAMINQDGSASPSELTYKNLALNYKEVCVIKASDGNLILNKYFKDRQKSTNRTEGCFEIDNASLYEDPDMDMHRLQRQDAKSRKTFKIKRHCSTFNRTGILGGSMLRSATVKGAAGHHRFLSYNKESADKTLDVSQKTPNNKLHPDKAESETSLLNSHLSTDTSKLDETTGPTSDADSQNKQTVLRLHKQSVYRSRFMQKSKSHEDEAPAGTARGKIARHGLKATQQSPVKSSENDVLLTKSESNESLKDEKSSLLDLKSHVDLDGSDDRKVDQP